MLSLGVQAMLCVQSGLLTGVHETLSCSFALLGAQPGGFNAAFVLLSKSFFFLSFAACRLATCLGRASILQTWYPRVPTTVTHLKLIP